MTAAAAAAYYDALETRSPELREQQLMAALSHQVAHAQTRAPAFTSLLHDVDASAIRSRAALARLPVTRKHELLERQRASRGSDVFGGFSTIGWGFASSRRPARSTSPRARRRITGAPPAACTPQDFAPVT